MGQYKYLINKKNKTIFNLGKSSLGELSYEPDVLFDKELLHLFIDEELSNRGIDYSRYEIKDYTERLWQFMDNPPVNTVNTEDYIMFSYDGGDDLFVAYALGYKMVDSVYGPKDVEESNEREEKSKYKFTLDMIKSNKVYWPLVEKLDKTLYEEFIKA